MIDNQNNQNEKNKQNKQNKQENNYVYSRIERKKIKQKIKSKHRQLVLCFVFISILVAVCGFSIINKNMFMQFHALELKSNDVEYIEYGHKYNIDLHKLLNLDYFNKNYDQKDIENFLKNNIKVTTNLKNEKNKNYPAVGTYGISINCNHSNKNSKKLFKKIVVQDTTKPKITCDYAEIDILQNTNINDYDFNSLNLCSVFDLSNVDVSYDKKDINSQKIGDYILKIIAKDEHKNKTTKYLKINITPQPNENQELITETIQNEQGLKIIRNTLKDKPKLLNELENSKEQNSDLKNSKVSNNQINSNGSNNSSINGICGREGNVSNDVINAVNKQLTYVPSKILNAFSSSGWKIFVTNKSIAREYDHSSGRIMGYTMYKEKQIVIENRMNAATESTIHEIGHFWDDYLGTPSQKSEFIRIYSAEKNSFKNTFNSRENNISQSIEYFGEAFFKYITDSNRFRNACPQTSAFFDQTLN